MWALDTKSIHRGCFAKNAVLVKGEMESSICLPNSSDTIQIHNLWIFPSFVSTFSFVCSLCVESAYRWLRSFSYCIDIAFQLTCIDDPLLYKTFYNLLFNHVKVLINVAPNSVPFKAIKSRRRLASSIVKIFKSPTIRFDINSNENDNFLFVLSIPSYSAGNLDKYNYFETDNRIVAFALTGITRSPHFHSKYNHF